MTRDAAISTNPEAQTNTPEANISRNNLLTNVTELQLSGQNTFKPDAASQATADNHLPKLQLTDSAANQSEKSNTPSQWNNQLKDASIILMRHAEKPTDPSNTNLSDAGYDRANEIAKWIPQQFGRNPDEIFAAADSKHSSRPSETVEPLSKDTNVPIDSSISNNNYSNLANELDNAKFDGQDIAIAWHHGNIVNLAKALGANPASIPEKWNKNDFDDAIRIDYGPNGVPTVQLLQIPNPAEKP